MSRNSALYLDSRPLLLSPGRVRLDEVSYTSSRPVETLWHRPRTFEMPITITWTNPLGSQHMRPQDAPWIPELLYEQLRARKNVPQAFGLLIAITAHNPSSAIGHLELEPDRLAVPGVPGWPEARLKLLWRAGRHQSDVWFHLGVILTSGAKDSSQSFSL